MHGVQLSSVSSGNEQGIIPLDPTEQYHHFLTKQHHVEKLVERTVM